MDDVAEDEEDVVVLSADVETDVVVAAADDVVVDFEDVLEELWLAQIPDGALSCHFNAPPATPLQTSSM